MAQWCSVRLLLCLCLPQIDALDLDAHVMVLGGGPGETLHPESRGLRNGVSAITEDHGSPPPFSPWGPPGPGPDPNHFWPPASRMVYYLQASMAVVFCYSSPKGPRPSTHSASVKKGLCVCVCVLCIGCVCVVYVSVSVVQNKATDSHILQGWALVADQTSRVSSLRALCSRPPLIVMRGILSHPFNNLKYLLHAGRRGRDWRSDTPSWVARGCGPPAGALGSGDRLM